MLLGRRQAEFQNSDTVLSRLKAQGYDFEWLIERVAALLDMPVEKVKIGGKRRASVKARSIACYWAHNELGMSQTELALKFGVSQPAVCAAVQKGQKIIKENQFRLLKNSNL